jgi:hypothetical protein
MVLVDPYVSPLHLTGAENIPNSMLTKQRGEMVCKTWLHKTIPESHRANEMIDAKEPMPHVRIMEMADIYIRLLT